MRVNPLLMVDRRSPRIATRLITCLLIWLSVATAYAVLVDLHVENGAETEERVRSVLFAPLFGTIGLAHAIGGNPRPSPALGCFCLAVLLAVSIGVVAARSFKLFGWLVAIEVCLVLWAFVGMWRLNEYWNIHGS